MGWKSTKTLSREEAIAIIAGNLHNLNNEQLENALGGMFGDDPTLPHYGRNFRVQDTVSEDEED